MKFYPNRAQWAVIWAAFALIFLGGLLLLDLQDLAYPSRVEQEVTLAQRKTARERDCEAAKVRTGQQGQMRSYSSKRLPQECCGFRKFRRRVFRKF
jgi:hypothetical protein